MAKAANLYIVVRGSDIHGRGVFARKNISAGTRIIEYVGEKITKAESERRAERVLHQSKQDTTKGAVYIFTLNKRYDIDGNVAYNPARFINHACCPNCEAQLIHGHIWIVAMRDIQRGEELSYNYGYDMDSYEEHPCRCGSHGCMGYIVAEEHWPKLKAKHLQRHPKRKLSHEEIVAHQAKFRRQRRVPLVVVLDNFRSAYNVGAAFRIADGAGIEKLWLCGITGYPPSAQISKTALGAEQCVHWQYHDDAVTVVKDYKAQGYQIIVLEQTDASFDYRDFEAKQPICLVLGNEIDGVSDAVVAAADSAMEIPMYGVKNSLNVSVACGIAVYHIVHSLREHIRV